MTPADIEWMMERCTKPELLPPSMKKYWEMATEYAEKRTSIRLLSEKHEVCARTVKHALYLFQIEVRPSGGAKRHQAGILAQAWDYCKSNPDLAFPAEGITHASCTQALGAKFPGWSLSGRTAFFYRLTRIKVLIFLPLWAHYELDRTKLIGPLPKDPIV